MTKKVQGRFAGVSRRSFLLASAATAVSATALSTGVATLVGLPKRAVAKTAAKKAKIVYWSPVDPKSNTSRARGEAAMVNVFKTRHPDIEIEIQPVPWQVMGQQVIQAVLAGGGPDVAQLSTSNLPDQVGAGTVAPLDDYVGKGWSKAEKDDFILPWDNTVYDGHKMAFYWNSLLNNEFWYLKDEVGGEPPTDWNKLVTFLKPLAKKTGKSGFLTGLSQNGNAIELTDWLIPALWASGAEYVTESGEVGFANENGAKPFEWLLEMVRKYKLTPESIVSLTRDNILDAMKGKKALTTLLTSNIVSAARKSLGQDLGLAVHPGPNGPCPAFASGKFLIMTKSCKEPEAAGLFIEAMISPEAQIANAKIAGELPARKSVLKDPWMDTPTAADIKFAMSYMAAHPHTFKYPKHTDYLQTQLALAAQKMMQGGNVRQALGHVAKGWETVRKS